MTLHDAFEAWKARPGTDTLVPLLEACRPAIHSLCRQVLRHEQDAEDATQAVLLQIHDHLPRIHEGGHLKAFVHQACFHVSLNLKRSRGRRRDHERIKAEQVDAAAPVPEGTVEAITEQLAQLDDATRSLVVARYFERRTIQELAAEARCSTTAVAKRLEKAREKLLLAMSRAGVALTAPSLDAFLSSVPPPSEALTTWAPTLAGTAMKSTAAAAAILVALVGIGILSVSAVRRAPPAEPPLASSGHAGNRSIAGTAVPGTLSASAPVGVAADEEPEAPEPRGGTSVILEGLKAFMRGQNPDGSWGDGVAPLEGRLIDPVGVTALSLLAFLGSGYSQLSKDVYDGLDAGETVRRSLQWLLARQRPDGSFLTGGEERISQALGTLALSEAYGMTAAMPLKEPAQRAIDAFLRLQHEDGSWGDDTTNLWAAEALKSAILDELTIDLEAVARAQRFYRSQLDAGPNLPALIGHLFLSRDGTHPAVRPTIDRVACAEPDATRRDFMYWYMGSMALFQVDGPEGAIWKNWSEPFRKALYATGTKEGTWPGGTKSATSVQTSLALLSLEIYYRYANVLGGTAVQK
jgi:RNA polymerase sigma factor (sigma-70 family)